MSVPRPFYGLAKFATGDRVKIVSKAALEDFFNSWKFNNPLEANQLAFGGSTARVEEVRMYHGGYIIYRLRNLPGLWHERLLVPISDTDL